MTDANDQKERQSSSGGGGVFTYAYNRPIQFFSINENKWDWEWVEGERQRWVYFWLFRFLAVRLYCVMSKWKNTLTWIESLLHKKKNTNNSTNMSFAVAFIVHLIVQIKSYWFLFFCSADRMRAHQAVERASMCCENEKNIKIVHFRHSSQWMKNLFTKINKHWTHMWNSYHRYLPSKLSN